MKKTFILSLLLLTLAVFLCSCRANPNNSNVVSKNDGAFDAAIIAGNDSSGNIIGNSFSGYTSEFSSTDGTVKYTVQLGDDQVFDGELPVIQVRPHFYTEDDARRVFSVLFGDVPAFDWATHRQMTKSEIEEKLLQWQQLCTGDNLRDIFGDDEQAIQVNRETLESLISMYSDPALYNAAPNTFERPPFQWTFRDDGEGNKDIEAGAIIGELSYHYWVFNRDKDDYRINNLSASTMTEIVSANAESFELMCKLCSSEKPNNEQLDAAKAKAETIIEKIGLGEWTIDSCAASAQYISEAREVYFIEIKAVPTYKGLSVTRVPQLTNLKSGDLYAESYYYSDLNMRFTSNGTLLSLQLVSPMDVVQIINDNVNVLSFNAIMEKAEEQLALSDVQNYFFVGSKDQQYYAEVTIDEIALGLSRTRVKDNKTNFYYIPTVTLKGSYKVFEQDGTLVYDHTSSGGNKQVFLVLNAIDNSVINTSNGY